MEKKWNLQDIKPAERKPSVRKSAAAPVERETDMRRKAPAAEPESTPAPRVQRTERRRVGGNKKATMLILGGAAIILVVGFIASMIFGGAVVEVEPKQKDVTVQANFTAHAAPEAGQLGYELLTLEATSERQVTATGKETVSLQAEGTITIFNAASDAPQRLIKNTRFESPEGLIFRVFESIEVPGRTKAADGSIIPGSATARVFADAKGDEYNVGPTTFVVPGLRGTDQFEGVYAESKEAFTGGFEGERFIIDENELTVVKNALHEELQTALKARLQSERPAGFVLFENAVTFEYTSLPSAPNGENLAAVKEQGRLIVPIFKEDEFAAYIAKNTIAGFENEAVLIESPSALSFAYQGSATANAALRDVPSIDFSLSGNAHIIWQFNEEKLKEDLVGISKTALPTILSGYPAIEKAEVVIKPFWKQSFPEKADEITLKINIGG